MKHFKFYLLTVALVMIVIALVLVLLEWFFRRQSLQASLEKRDHVTVTDYLPVKFKPHYRGTMWDIAFSTNAYGFRDEPDFPAEVRAGEIRVFSVGDSIGFGLGIEAKNHYCKVTERLLQNKFPGTSIRLINVSGQGYSPSGYYVYLRNEGMYLHPSMVIIEIELCNDLTDEALLRWKLADEKYPVAVRGGRYMVAWDGNLLGTYAVGGYPWEKSYVYTDLLRRSLNLLDRFFPSPLFSRTPGGTVYYSLGFDQYLLDQSRIEEGWHRLLGALEGTRQLCAERQIPFLLLIMPSRYLFEDSAPDHRDLAMGLIKRAETEIQRRGIPFLNMCDPIAAAGGAALFFDFAHLTVEGNRAVGEALTPTLAKMIGAAATASRTVVGTE